MTIYQSEFLNIRQQGETLIQTWTEKKLSVDDYQFELSNFLQIFNKTKPKELIWDTKKCSFILPESLDTWMVEKILIPIHKQGIQKQSFTIPENIPVYLSIVESLEKAKPIIQSAYFSDINEALVSSETKEKSIVSIDSSIFECEINADEKALHLDLNIPYNDLPHFLASLKQVNEDNLFVEHHQEKFYSLTIREKQIFRLIALGQTNKQISQALFIEDCSVKTHRKNIKKKLNINSNFDIYQYARCFGVL